jgi:hypothetical protein
MRRRPPCRRPHALSRSKRASRRISGATMLPAWQSERSDPNGDVRPDVATKWLNSETRSPTDTRASVYDRNIRLASSLSSAPHSAKRKSPPPLPGRRYVRDRYAATPRRHAFITTPGCSGSLPYSEPSPAFSPRRLTSRIDMPFTWAYAFRIPCTELNPTAAAIS